MNCEQCRAQLLPLVYDLLESPEQAVMTVHLQGCSDCQNALRTARVQQGMLAEAVKQIVQVGQDLFLELVGSEHDFGVPIHRLR